MGQDDQSVGEGPRLKGEEMKRTWKLIGKESVLERHAAAALPLDSTGSPTV
jgi:hypothetical protein